MQKKNQLRNKQKFFSFLSEDSRYIKMALEFQLLVRYIILYFNVFHYNSYIKKVEVHSQQLQLIGSSKNFFYISQEFFFPLNQGI